MDYYIAGSMSGLDFHSAEKLAAENFPSVHRYIGGDNWHVSHLSTSPVHEGQRPFMVTMVERLRLESHFEATYKNYRGEVAKRRLHPIQITFKSTEWHPEPQWILVAYDLDKKQRRDFALKDFNPLTFPQDYEGIGKRLLEIGAMCDDQEIARTAYDAATALASPVPMTGKAAADIGPLKQAWEKLYAASKDVQRILEEQKEALQVENASLKAAQADDDVRVAAKALLKKYVELVYSGDCGSWDAEKEEEVIALRKALENSKPEKYRNPDIFHDAEGRN